MRFLAFTNRSAQTLPHATRADLKTIDAALADEKTREFAEIALALVVDLVEVQTRQAQEEPLGENERAALDLLGIDASDPMTDIEFYRSPVVQSGLVSRASMIQGAIPLKEAARRLSVNDSRLRQRIAEGTLVAIRKAHGRGWLIPAFQMTDQGELPHLARVLMRRQRSVGPETLARVFELPNDELGGRSPRDWLMAGGDPAPVERVVAAL